MEKLNNKTSRKKFLFWGLIAISSGFFYTLFTKKKKNEINAQDTVKLLTEDGRLVEVDKKYITKTGIKINTDDIHDWVKKQS